MSERCEITGLSPENVSRFQYLHSFVTGGLEIPTPSSEALAGFAKPLENTISNNRIHNNEVKRRDGLLKHLEKSIASKFNGSKLLLLIYKIHKNSSINHPGSLLGSNTFRSKY